MDDNSGLMAEEDGEDEGIVIEYINIKAPLSELKSSLEAKYAEDLTEYLFYLQDSHLLSPSSTLADQCIEGDGLVEVTLEFLHEDNVKKINILDVQRPSEKILEQLSEKVPSVIEDSERNNEPAIVPSIIEVFERNNEPAKVPPTTNTKPEEEEVQIIEPAVSSASTSKQSSSVQSSSQPTYTVVNSLPSKQDFGPGIAVVHPTSKQSARWVIDQSFFSTPNQYQMPRSVNEWSYSDVRRWYRAAKKHFDIEDSFDELWRMSGALLTKLSYEQVSTMVPPRCCQKFWGHLQFVKTSGLIAFLQEGHEGDVKSVKALVCPELSSNAHMQARTVIPDKREVSDNSSGLANTPQLWQFLLDLLTDYQCLDSIRWTDTEGEFRFTSPETIAHLWGQKKKKPNMNYGKLSRALRYYYEPGNIIAKVPGKRFTYRFVCDLKFLVGLDASELKRSVESTYERMYGKAVPTDDFKFMHYYPSEARSENTANSPTQVCGGNIDMVEKFR